MNRWINAEVRLPTREGEYIVEYIFPQYRTEIRFHAVYKFDVVKQQFENEGFKGLKIIRWAYMPED